MTTLRFFGADEIHAALAWPRLVDALAEAFAAGAEVPLRHAHVVAPREHGRLLLMPAWRRDSNADSGVANADAGVASVGVKIVTVFPANAARGAATVGALYVLLDGATGHPRAVLDGEALTLRRTGGASALASRFLARPESATLAVVGAGALAPYLAEAHCAVRPIRRVLVWARRADAARALVVRLEAKSLPAEPAPALDRALAEADIVTCATTAVEPVLRSASVRSGTHVDLVGGFTRQMREADDALIARASVFVDTRRGALAEAGDLVQPMEAGVIRSDHVRAELAELVTGQHPGRQSAAEITLFKSVGSALEDLCAAELVWNRSQAAV
jgi:ornithine cyclodeaminase